MTMAELATIARPYADALFKAVEPNDALAVADQVNELAAIAANVQLREYADNPKTQDQQVFELFTGVAKGFLGDGARNLLRIVIENGRLSALPEIAAQFQRLVNTRSGVLDALVYSAFPIEGETLAGVMDSLEKRFQRKLNGKVLLDTSLIGGIRVVVGDEVLDTSVKSRLEQMKVALTA
jgi:F-type H+-transporting ATPase subunit delta